MCYILPGMTQTTTLRLDDALKARIAAAAERAGTSAHAFMLDAIATTLDQAEQAAAFAQVAETRWASLVAGGGSLGWDATRTWLEARARGEAPPPPTPRPPVG
jgi:uncharacterized protein (DUF1778 family)